ncbi:hypothetical protein GGR57DRAFT_456285 [Xylariaceae sp. FL1272]|nr:hypothetical protein GGR57DRAFT_456285 [Xylariaceae sp. FL1272]
MSLFKPFNDLPKELRLTIWELALAEELTSRLVILYQFCIIPTKNIISPLLSVNAESRGCALALYDTKVTIYRMPALEPDSELANLLPIWIEHEQALETIVNDSDDEQNAIDAMDVDDESDDDDDSYGEFNDYRFMLHGSIEEIMRDPDSDPAYWSSLAVLSGLLASQERDFSDWELFRSSVHHAIRDIKAVGRASGTVYVSATEDRFLLANPSDGDPSLSWKRGQNDMMEPFWAEAAAEFREMPLTANQLSWKYITSQLSTTDLRCIETVVLAEDLNRFQPTRQDLELYQGWGSTRDYDGYSAPFCCTLSNAKLRWKAQFFQAVQTCDHIWYRHGMRSFLLDVVTKPVQELDIQRWTRSTDSGWGGMVVQTLVEDEALVEIRRAKAEMDEFI